MKRKGIDQKMIIWHRNRDFPITVRYKKADRTIEYIGFRNESSIRRMMITLRVATYKIIERKYN